MNLSSTELSELNGLLKSHCKTIPDFRRTVSSTGANYHWLQKNLIKNNPNPPERMKQLLFIK